MSYRYEQNPITQQPEIVIDGWEKGIADSPYQGISDMRCANIISIPNEVSVNFSTVQHSQAKFANGTILSTSAANDTLTYTGPGLLVDAMAITFTTVNFTSNPTVTTTFPYWVGSVSGGTFKLYTDMAMTDLVDITGTSGTGSFEVVNMGTPKYSTSWDYIGGSSFAHYYWIVDDNGLVWLSNGGGVFEYQGNIVIPKTGGTAKNSHGNGIIYYQGYLFVFRNSQIDYQNIATGAWVYGWNYQLGTATTWDTVVATLNSTYSDVTPHDSIIGLQNKVFFCDSGFISSFFQTDPAVTFDPSNLATYTPVHNAVGIETNDTAVCLELLGTNILIGGSLNKIYVTDGINFKYINPIFLAESYVTHMKTINTTTYLLIGNRGRIYQTNGSQVSLFKKVPDHISGTVEPYFTWGGVGSHKNQLYFGVSATKNDGTALTNYGGLWAVDVDTKAMRLVNQLSYGDYTGRATVIIPVMGDVGGTGLMIGWTTSTYNSTYGYYYGGADITSSTLYTQSYNTPNYKTYIDTDLIPVGTYLNKKTFYKVEYKLTTPMTSSGDAIRILYRTNMAIESGNATSDGFTVLPSSQDVTYGEYNYVSGAEWNMAYYYNVNFENVQWVQFRIELDGGNSYTRLKEIRIS